jgi:hypothetical protein
MVTKINIKNLNEEYVSMTYYVLSPKDSSVLGRLTSGEAKQGDTSGQTSKGGILLYDTLE